VESRQYCDKHGYEYKKYSEDAAKNLSESKAQAGDKCSRCRKQGPPSVPVGSLESKLNRMSKADMKKEILRLRGMLEDAGVDLDGSDDE
jgi:hypothetical protein